MKLQNYYFLSTVDWKSYLHAYAIADEIHLAVSDQTRRLVASNKALAKRYGSAFNQIASTLDMGFERLKRSLAGVEASIDSLAADFNYHMGLLLDELQIQRGIFIRIADRLDGIYKVLITPMRTRARELFKEGCALVGKGLLDKALEYLHKSEKEYDVDFFTHFQLGKLYLYGIDRENSVIDLKKAEQHLRLAVRYGKPEIKQLKEMRKLTAEALLHLSVACYAQGVELRKAGKEKEALEKVKEARDFTREAKEINAHLSEIHYHLAKYSAVLGDTQQAISSLESAIFLDRNYCLKADADPDFDKIRTEIQNLLKKLKKRARFEAESEIERWQKEKNELKDSLLFRLNKLEDLIFSLKMTRIKDPAPDYPIYNPDPDMIEGCIKKVKNEVEILANELTSFENKIAQRFKETLAIDRYFDYLDFSPYLREEIRKIRDKIDNIDTELFFKKPRSDAKYYKLLEYVLDFRARVNERIRRSTKSNTCIICGNPIWEVGDWTIENLLEKIISKRFIDALKGQKVCFYCRRSRQYKR